MSDFKIGDKIEVIYHAVSSYVGKKGKVMFIGTTLRQGTDMLENNINVVEQDPRLIVALDDSTILDGLRDSQLRKI